MPPDALHARIDGLLDRRRANGNLRSLDPPSYDPASLVDFSSNDYLSLSRSSALREDLLRNLSESSIYGPASSRLLDGNSTDHLQLEAQLADFFRGEAGLLFNSGFDANAGLFACLPSANDVLIYDSLIHASVHDGMRHSRCKNRQAFKHNDVGHLRHLLRTLLDGGNGQEFRKGTNQVFVAVEALYSMDGDLAPLKDLVDVIEEMLPNGNGHLIVDEAHSTGLYGPEGRGLTCALGLENRVLIRLHTFGKAMACSGGTRC
jgi:8-amino-7-oxononanoate synthase